MNSFSIFVENFLINFLMMRFIIILTMLISLTACGSGSNVTTSSSANDQNVSKFEESKFGTSSFN